MPGRDIIVIGASAGGVEALSAVVRALPEDLPAAVFIVLHIAPTRSLLPEILGRRSAMEVVQPTDGELIHKGCIYVAPPDHHMLVEDGQVRVTLGPKENSVRPAADPLFRTAAKHHRGRVIAVVLSGNLDDGTAGAMVVNRYGGVVIAQDPEEALYPGMPRSVIDHAQVDYVVPLAEIAPLLSKLVREPAPAAPEGVDEMVATDPGVPDPAEVGASEAAGQQLPFPPTALTCPECGGSLWELRNGELLRYRCHVGHAYSPESLASEQGEKLEMALWTALRSLQEAADLSTRMARRAREHGHSGAAAEFETRARDQVQRAAVIRDVLTQQRGSEPRAQRTRPLKAETG